MSRKRVLIHAITWSTLVVFIIIASVLGIHFSNPRSATSSSALSPFLESSAMMELEHDQVAIPKSNSSNTNKKKFNRKNNVLKFNTSSNNNKNKTTSAGAQPEHEVAEEEDELLNSYQQVLELLNQNQSIMIGSSSLVNGEPVSEVRSTNGGAGSGPTGGSYVSSRPVYQKSIPYKPKLVLAKQLQLHTNKNNDPVKDGENPNLITQTVYGFLDFTTTVGNTVMIFTPQTKKVELIEPSSTIDSQITSTSINNNEDHAESEEYDNNPSSSESPSTSTSPSTTTTTGSSGGRRSPKGFGDDDKQQGDEQDDEQFILLESSESDITPSSSSVLSSSSSKAAAGFIILATPAVTTTTTESTSTKGKKSSNSAASAAPTSNPVEIRTQVNVISSNDDDGQFEETSTKTTSTTPKGFTLKLSNKSSSSNGNGTNYPSSFSSSIAAQTVTLTPNVYNNNSTSTSSSSTLTKYAPIIAQIVPTTASTIIKKTSLLLAASASAASSTPTNFEIRTEKSVISSSSNNNNDNDDENNNEETAKEESSAEQYSDSHQESGEEEHDEEHHGEEGEEEEERQDEAGEEQQQESEESDKPESVTIIKPTKSSPSTKEDQTHYILPQTASSSKKSNVNNIKDAINKAKNKNGGGGEEENVAQIYSSSSPGPNSYSRQPALYVDIISPDKSFDYIVTATPSSFGSSSSGRKQFHRQSSSTGGASTNTGAGGAGTRNEYLNRFSNRFSRKKTPAVSSTESNEVSEQQQIIEDPPSLSPSSTFTRSRSSGSGGGSNRFRSRSNGRSSAKSSAYIELEPSTSASTIYSHLVTAIPSTTATRRFSNGRTTRNNAASNNNNNNNSNKIKNYAEQDNSNSNNNNNGGGGGYKSSRGGFSRSKVTSNNNQHNIITPTSSSSIYRFKLNRPTGRWRFKPSPKPKVSIIKSKEDEPNTTNNPQGSADDNEGQHGGLLGQQSINGPAVYPIQYGIPVDGNENYQYGLSNTNNANNNNYDDSKLILTTGGENEIVQPGQQDGGQDYEDGGDGDGDSAPSAALLETKLLPQTLRVSTIHPTEYNEEMIDKYLEVATIKSPYVFQAGNVKNTRYITLTKTFTKDVIQPTSTADNVYYETNTALHGGHADGLENILATRILPYDKILEGSNDVATLPVVVLGEEMATPPLETVTQTFSTTQLMLKTSILPVLYDGITTLYTLTQSYFVTRLVTAHKTIPPMELFQFIPTKSLREFNTALQEAESEHLEHREQLLGSESDPDNENNGNNNENYQQIVAAPDELKLVGSEFDPSAMDDKIPSALQQQQQHKQSSKSSKNLLPKKTPSSPTTNTNSNGIPDLSNLTPEQLAFFRFLTTQNQISAQAQQVQAAQAAQIPTPQQYPLLPNYFQSPILPTIPQLQQQQQQQQQQLINSSPIIYDTLTTIVETKTLRILFGAKPTQTTLYSTKVIPTKVTSYVAGGGMAATTIPVPGLPGFGGGGYPFGGFVG